MILNHNQWKKPKNCTYDYSTEKNRLTIEITISIYSLTDRKPRFSQISRCKNIENL